MGLRTTLSRESALTRVDARLAGYVELAGCYREPEETWMLERVIADMERGGISWVLVSGAEGVEVWRGMGGVS